MSRLFDTAFVPGRSGAWLCQLMDVGATRVEHTPECQRWDSVRTAVG